MLASMNPDDARTTLRAAQEDIDERWRVYESLAAQWPTADG
jgi:hypothetical protein